MNTSKTNRIPNEILDEATTWFVEFSEGEVSPPARQQFIAWLRTSPEHIRAYLQITAHWEDARALGSTGRHNIDELIALARADSNIVAIQSPLKVPVSGFWSGVLPQQSDQVQKSAGLKTRHRHHYKFSLAASIALVAFGFFAWYWYNYQVNTYTTAVGEQRSITLVDGSTVELNSRTKIRVVYHEHVRGIQLLDGQALFHVAKDRTRPFIVHTNATNIRAVGTQFDVYKKHDATVVTVLEGKVAVIPGNGQGLGGFAHGSPSAAAGSLAQFPTPAGSAVQSQHGLAALSPPVTPSLSMDGKGAASSARGGRGPSPPSGGGWGEDRIGENSSEAGQALDRKAESRASPVFLAAGEQLTVTSTEMEKAVHPDLPAATAWTQKQIAFKSTPLTEVAEEFNRYNTRQLIITDNTIATIRISGVFSSTDPSSLLRGLNTLGKFTIRETPDRVEISAK